MLDRAAVVSKIPKVTEVLPLLYLHGMSTGDFVPALEGFFGSGGAVGVGDQATWVDWQDEHRRSERSLEERDFVYVWVDGVHFNVRLEEERLCCLVMVGVRLDGHKELVAIRDGYRESTDSWAALLRDSRRGMRAPVLAVGDGALGFWAALREVFPETREQRDWFHKASNVLGALPHRSSRTRRRCSPRSATPRTTTTHARRQAVRHELGVKCPKATAKITDDLDQLLRFYDFPLEHWIHLKTSNPIESTFATVRLRTKVTKGSGSERRPRDGVQAHRRRPRPLAQDQRAATRRARTRRSQVQKRGPRRGKDQEAAA